MAELPPPGRAVDGAGLVDLGGDRAEPAHEQQEREAEVLPHVHRDHHDHRPLGAGQPGHGGDPEEGEQPVDDAVALVEQVLHEDRDARGGEHQREEEGRAEEDPQPSRHPGADQHREQHRDDQLGGDGEEHEHGGVEEGDADGAVGRHRGEVRQAHELRGGDDVPAEEGQHERADDRQHHEDADAEHRGGQEQPAQQGAVAVGGHEGSSSAKTSRRSASSDARERATRSGPPDRAVETLRISAVSTAACWGGAGIGPVSGKRSSVS